MASRSPRGVRIWRFAVESQLVDEMFRVIKTINQTGTTILLVEQNVALALEVADYGYVLETGAIALEGSAQQLCTAESIKSAYL